MSNELEMVKGYCVGGLSMVPGLDESSDYMLGYRKALENMKRYVELLQAAEQRMADEYWDKQEAA